MTLVPLKTCLRTGIALAILAGTVAVRADDAEAGPPAEPVPFDAASLAGVEDHTPLDRPEEAEARDALLAHVATTPAADLRRDARRWRLRRRRDLPEFAGNSQRSLDLFADAIAHPETARGEAFIVWGRTLDAGSLDAVEGARVARVALYDERNRPVLLLLPKRADPPPPTGTPVVAAGRFLKVTGEGANEVPVVVVGGITILGDRLDPELMRDVVNLTRRRPEERDAYLTAIAHAKLADTERLRQLALDLRAERIKAKKFSHPPEKFPTYVDLFKELDFDGQQPNAYQGRPVTLQGHVRSISREPLGENAEEYGLDHLYSLLLYTEDSQTVPTLVICTEIPAGLPTSGHLEDAIDGIGVTGFVFKMQVYEDQREDARKIPVVIARGVTWNPPAEVDLVPRFGPTAYAVVAIVLLGLLGLGWWVAARDRGARRAVLDEHSGAEPTFDNVTENDGRIDVPDR